MYGYIRRVELEYFTVTTEMLGHDAFEPRSHRVHGDQHHRDHERSWTR